MLRLDRDEVSAGTMQEYAELAGLLRSLDDDEWAAPTRCEGWTVADVAAHVAGQLTDTANLRLDGLGTPEVVARQVEERKGQQAEEVADEIQANLEVWGTLVAGFDQDAWDSPIPGDFPGTIGEGVLGLWYDTWVHGDDIRTAVGREPDRGPGLRAAVARLTAIIERDGRGALSLELDGIEPVEVGGGGTKVEGDPRDFVLAATGRADPAVCGLEPSINVYADDG